MVSNEEIKRRLELRRKGIDPDKKPVDTEVHRPPVRSKPEKSIRCPQCGTLNPEHSKFCINCGHELKKKEKKVIIKDSEANTITCPECGTKNTATSKFCIGCGKNLNESPQKAAQKPTENVETAPEQIPTEDPGLSKNDETVAKSDLSSEEDVHEEIVDKDDLFEEIKKAKELLDIGAITEEEYEKIKNNYLKKFQ